MINLFHIPTHVIDTAKYSNLFHDPIVRKLEETLAEYVGAKYALATSSATQALFLATYQRVEVCTIPSLVTTRFLNYIERAGNTIKFTDDVDWIGCTYQVCSGVYDSAQRLTPNQYANAMVEEDGLYSGDDLFVFSFYPTKPLGGLGGGLIVSNNKEKIDALRELAYFGEDFSADSWLGRVKEKGYQAFMNSVQADIILRNLDNYRDKMEQLDWVIGEYMDRLPHDMVITKNSYHLFRVMAPNYCDNDYAVKKFKEQDIVAGIHYKPAHLTIYGDHEHNLKNPLPLSEEHGHKCVSLPFHEKLTIKEIEKVCSVYETL